MSCGNLLGASSILGPLFQCYSSFLFAISQRARSTPAQGHDGEGLAPDNGTREMATRFTVRRALRMSAIAAQE